MKKIGIIGCGSYMDSGYGCPGEWRCLKAAAVGDGKQAVIERSGLLPQLDHHVYLFALIGLVVAFWVETASRARSIVMAEPAYYGEAADAAGEVAPMAGSWALRRLKGKLWSVARLSKAAFTFSGGAEYLAWKIERHSGHKVELSDWQKRHPVIAGLVLLPQLLWRGTVR